MAEYVLRWVCYFRYCLRWFRLMIVKSFYLAIMHLSSVNSTFDHTVAMAFVIFPPFFFPVLSPVHLLYTLFIALLGDMSITQSQSYWLVIIVSTRWISQLPAGTHEWSSFLTPEELVLILERASISVSRNQLFSSFDIFTPRCNNCLHSLSGPRNGRVRLQPADGTMVSFRRHRRKFHCIRLKEDRIEKAGTTELLEA